MVSLSKAFFSRSPESAHAFGSLDPGFSYNFLSAIAHGGLVPLQGIIRAPAALLTLVPTVVFRAVRDWSMVVQSYADVSLDTAFQHNTLDGLYSISVLFTHMGDAIMGPDE